MKTKLMVVSTILLIVLIVAGSTMAWFTSSSNEENNEFKLGTVIVEVEEEGFSDINGAIATTYDKNVKIRSLGTKRTYVRVRLVPEWSDSSLSVSNVKLNLVDNGDWVYSDGYYYFKYYLTTDQLTSLLLESVEFTELGEEYEGKTFSLHVIVEGVQITHDAWKKVWGINSLPFTPNEPWIP